MHQTVPNHLPPTRVTNCLNGPVLVIICLHCIGQSHFQRDLSYFGNRTSVCVAVVVVVVIVSVTFVVANVAIRFVVVCGEGGEDFFLHSSLLIRNI